MINLYDQVPMVYVNASRDFQYLSWLTNVVLNSVKHNVDDLYYLPNTSADVRITELLAMTLGFKIKRNYDKKQLEALVACLPTILKHKGTLYAAYIAGNALLTAAGAPGECECEADDGMLKIVIPKSLVDISLFNDLLPYILPAGVPCKVIRKNQITKRPKTYYHYSDAIYAKVYNSEDILNNDDTPLSGFGSLFIPGTTEPSFANFHKNSYVRTSDGKWIKTNYTGLTTGLQSNTLVPTLDFGTVTPGNITSVESKATVQQDNATVTIDAKARATDEANTTVAFDYGAVIAEDKQVILD